MPVWVPKIETRRPLRESPGRTSTRGSPRGRRLIQVLAVGRTSAKAAEVKRHVNDADLLRRGAAVSQRAPSPRPSRHSSTGVAWARGPSGAPGGAGGRPLARSSSGRRDPRRPPQQFAEPHARRVRIARSTRRRGRHRRSQQAPGTAPDRTGFTGLAAAVAPTRMLRATSCRIRAVRRWGARGRAWRRGVGGPRAQRRPRRARVGFGIRRRSAAFLREAGSARFPIERQCTKPRRRRTPSRPRARRRHRSPRASRRRNPRCPAQQAAEPRARRVWDHVARQRGVRACRFTQRV